MIPKYTPILKAKQGEFDAQTNLPIEVKNKILPLFELPKFTESTSKLSICRGKENPIECYLNRIINNIALSCGNTATMLDMFNWAPNSTIENGEHVLNYTICNLIHMGVPVTPVIGYDRWEDPEYSNALKHLPNTDGKFCIRLESYAFEDMLDTEHFVTVIEEIIEALDLNTSLCNVLLDFGDVTKASIVVIQETIESALLILSKYSFEFISIAGSSITKIINDMVADRDSTGIVLRREMVAWQASKKSVNAANLVFGDYGVTNPAAEEVVIAPDANGKIRYTIGKNYFIARGHSRRQGNKGEQMYDLSKAVINSGYYMDPKYSWGDQRIMSCSNGEFKGRPHDWVAIDTNHHIKAVLSEIFEFERSVAPTKTTIKETETT